MRPGTRSWLATMALGAFACKTEAPTKTAASDDATLLSPEEQLVRVSMALRGLRPSTADLQAVRADPTVLRSLAEGYAQSEAFVATTEDLFAEVLRMRSVDLVVPNTIPDTDVYLGTGVEVRDALAEEPLRIVGEVVRHDLPLTELVTADWTVLDETGAQIWADHTYDTAQGGQQVVSYTDGRPAAGILSTSGFLKRHESNGGNLNRGRASVLSDVFLCDSYSDRDIPIEGDLTDEDAVAEAVLNDPACVSCHQSVDPLAATFIPLRPRLPNNSIAGGYADGCDDPRGFNTCYPVSMYFPEFEGYWEEAGLRAPAYFGAEADSLQDIGDHIAEDARFSSCMAQRFAAYLTQRDLKAVPPEEVAALQQVLIDSGMSARTLAVAVVTDPRFLSAEVHTEDGTSPTDLQVLRPEQLDRMVADLTGLRLEATVSVHGDVPILADDLLGFRAMSGGIDGSTVTMPTHLPTPTKLLTMAMVAEEAAGHVVERDLDAPSGSRQLLQTVDRTTTDEATVRAELVHLHSRISGLSVAADSPDVDDALALWQAVAESDSPTLAWKTVIAAMLQSPEVLYY